MKKSRLFLFACIITITSVSCHSEKKQNLTDIKSGNIVKTDVNYFYLQNTPENKTKVPLLLVIDAHGGGKFAAEKFKSELNNHPGIIIGLNNVRNNITNFNILIYKAINDAVQSFPIDRTKIYLAGFSGGARMAWQYATNYGCSGLIMCGAGPSNANNMKIPFPLVMITGTQDFNFIEQYYPPSSSVINNFNLITLHFKGGHEWPSDSLLVQAYGFISKNNEYQQKEIETCISNSKQLELNHDYLLCFKQLELAYKISEPAEKEKIKVLINELTSKSEFKNYISGLEQNLNNEISRNRNYMQAIESKNIKWWQKEMDNIEEFSNDTNNILKSDSYARTKAFLGVFLFSKTNQLIRQRNNKMLNKALFVYEQLEPENPDVFYYKSLCDFLNNDTLKSVKSMKKAYSLGFSDNARLKRDFPEDMITLFNQ